MKSENRKLTNKYYLSVEGETEQRYFEHLQKLINSDPNRQRNAILYCKVEKNPLSFAKSLKLQNTSKKTVLYHVFDYEGDGYEERKVFHQTMDRMKEVSRIGKSVRYEPGYSNLTFELWLILHRKPGKSVSQKEGYLKEINDTYHCEFLSLSEMKESNNMERILGMITINDVLFAIETAEKLEQNNRRSQKPGVYRGYEYFERNPSLSVHEIVKKIIAECGLLYR